MEQKSFGEATFHGVLFVFDAGSRLVYCEVFPERTEAIAAIPTSGKDVDVLLVGGENKIWEYPPLRSRRSRARRGRRRVYQGGDRLRSGERGARGNSAIERHFGCDEILRRGAGGG